MSKQIPYLHFYIASPACLGLPWDICLIQNFLYIILLFCGAFPCICCSFHEYCLFTPIKPSDDTYFVNSLSCLFQKTCCKQGQESPLFLQTFLLLSTASTSSESVRFLLRLRFLRFLFCPPVPDALGCKIVLVLETVETARV